MRILIVSRSIPLHDGAGGMERLAWRRATEAAQAGDEVHVLTTPVPGRPREFVEDGVVVAVVPDVRPGRYSPGWWLKTARWRGLERFDLIRSESASATAMVHVQPRNNYVFVAHGTAVRELRTVLKTKPRKWVLKALRYVYWASLDNLTYRRVNKVVAVSDHVASALRAFPYKRAWNKTELVVVKNDVDTRHFQFDASVRAEYRHVLGIPDSAPVVASIGRLDPNKGVDRAIAALEFLDESSYLIIAGVGSEEHALRVQAAAAGVADRVKFLGLVDYDGVRQVLFASDAFVFPVRDFSREGLPMAVLEAVAAGLRPVVPVESSWPEDVNQHLVRADAGSPHEFAAAIREAQVSPAAR
jgi:glycosyltransferase involved in cell wall biosynthesis